MKRKISLFLNEWQNRKDKLPLLLLGARQIGKTYILKEFAKENFSSCFYINFEENPKMLSLFEDDLNIDRIISDIELSFSKKIDAKNDIIIFDEVQLSPKCVTSLKYFAENNNKYHVACAGSLLGVMLNRSNLSFPVGKVEFKKMYPLTFDEFLVALGHEILVDKIKTNFKENRPMPDDVHKKLLALYKDYLCVGGMPMSVLEYINKGNDIIAFNREIPKNIVNAYIADMGKYSTSSENIKIQSIFKSLPEQLSRENKKFKYSTVKKGAKASHFDSAIEWLVASNVHIICKAIKTAKFPISAYIKPTFFKIFMNDIGLLNSLANIPFIILKDDEDHLYKGAIVENYVAMELSANNYELYYYSDDRMEIDFIIQRHDEIIPIEVKSKRNKRSRSFNKYMKQYSPSRGIRITQGNFGLKDNIKSIPLYAAFCI